MYLTKVIKMCVSRRFTALQQLRSLASNHRNVTVTWWKVHTEIAYQWKSVGPFCYGESDTIHSKTTTLCNLVRFGINAQDYVHGWQCDEHLIRCISPDKKWFRQFNPRHWSRMKALDYTQHCALHRVEKK